MAEEESLTYKNNPDLVRDINRLWMPVYAGLARQVAEACGSKPQRILELGCFSGGTGLALLDVFPEARLTIALDMPDLIATFQKDWKCPDDRRIVLREISLDKLFLLNEKYDLVFCRGAFFFLDPEAKTIQEIFDRVDQDGTAFWGGGYGCYTPDAVIAEIGDESRVKNNALGRRLYSVQQLERLLQRSGLADRSEIIEQGGLWVRMRK